MLRHELNRVKASGHAQEAAFALAVTAMSRLFNTASDVTFALAVTAMSRLFNTASDVVQVCVLGCSKFSWQQWAARHETKWVRLGDDIAPNFRLAL